MLVDADYFRFTLFDAAADAAFFAACSSSFSPLIRDAFDADVFISFLSLLSSLPLFRLCC